jgi:hypothetical protein
MTALPPDCVQVAPDIAVPGDVGGTCAVLQYLLVAPLLQMTMSALDMPLSPTPMPTHASWDRVTVNSIVVLSLEIVNVPESLSSNVNAPALACATAKAAKKQRTVAKGLILGRLLLCTTYCLKIGLKINKSFPFFFLSFKLFNLYSFFFFFFQIVSINVF